MGAHDGMSADPPSEGESKSVRWEITRQLKGKDVRERTGFYTGLYLHLYLYLYLYSVEMRTKYKFMSGEGKNQLNGSDHS